MPENETLYPDTQSVNRWRPLRDRIAGGESPDVLFPEFQEEFYRSLRKVFDQWKRHGVNPGQVFAAALNDPVRLRKLVQQTWNDEHAILLRDCIDGEEPSNLEEVIRSFLNSKWEIVRDQLQVDCREDGVPGTFLNSVNRMIDKLTRELIDNPSRMPCRRGLSWVAPARSLAYAQGAIR